MNVVTDSRFSVNRDRLSAGVRNVLAVGVATGIAAVITLPAAAQDAGVKQQEPRVALEEIVVTAQRREQAIQDGPISISAYTDKELESRSATSLSDLTISTPNMSFNNSAAGEYVRIRGVGASDISAYFDPGVGIYIDGVYMPRTHGTDLDLVGIERVEVLRGPQGTLFGRNTIGGAINITTKRPGDQASGSALVTTGSYDRLDLLASLDGPIVPGKLSGQLSGVARTRDGYGSRIDFATGAKTDEMGNQDRYSFRGNLVWTPNEDVEVLLTGDYSNVDEKAPSWHLATTYQTATVKLVNSIWDPDYTNQFVTPDPYTTYATGYNLERAQVRSASLGVSWNLASTTFRSITSYRSQEVKQGLDFDQSPMTMFEYDFNEKLTYWSQEFQLNGVSFDDRLTWVAGVYYGKEDTKSWAPSLIFQPLYIKLGLDTSQWATFWTDNWNGAVFGQGTYKLTDKLNMTVGARYSYDNKWVGRQRARANTGVIYLPFKEVEENWSATTGRFGFEYSPQEDLMAYISAARGYKSGGINGASTNALDMKPFDPEYLWTYEIGLRSEWLDRRLRFNASVFTSRYDGLQYRIPQVDPSGAIIQIVDNVAKAEINGLELELVAAPTPGLRLSAGVGYLDAKYTETKTGSPVTTNDKFVDTPEWSVSLSGEYTYALQSGAKIAGRADYSYLSEQQRWYINTPYLVQPGFSTLNARVAYQSADGNWEVALFGTNLTDEEVMTFGYDLSTAMDSIAQYGAPRQWGASLKYSF